jgi:IS30 family transposase
MLAYIREHNDAQSVIDIFNNLQETLNIDKFKELFNVILTDNGSEFSNPTEIEFDLKTGEKRTQIFYCHHSSPFEKGSCEVNHELLRRILPKGTSFDDLNQDDINLIMSHINSYKRKKLNNVSPYTMFSTIYGKETTDKLGIKEIEPNNVNLSKNLIKR